MKKLKETFGDTTSVPGKAMCRINGIIDVLEDIIVDANVAPFAIGERKLAIEQINKLANIPNALYLFDRGYWSHELVTDIVNNNQKFLMRLQSGISNTNIVDKNGRKITFRRYSFVLPSGNEEILLTNIPENEMTDDELVKLYAKRWSIETKYLELKERLQLDVLSGNTANIVLQDIYSTLFVSNLVAFICMDSDEIIQHKTADKNNLYKQKSNRAVCIAAYRQRFINIFLLDNDDLIASSIEKLSNDISKCVSYPGKSKPKPRKTKLSHKPLRRRSPKSHL